MLSSAPLRTDLKQFSYGKDYALVIAFDGTKPTSMISVPKSFFPKAPLDLGKIPVKEQSLLNFEIEIEAYSRLATNFGINPWDITTFDPYFCSKQKLIETFGIFFSRPANAFEIFYTGHGNASGDWYLGGKKEETFTLKDLCETFQANYSNLYDKHV